MNATKNPARPKLADIDPDKVQRSPQEALDELEREANVRLRCFDKWVEDGRISYTDAKDRLERLLQAWKLLAAVLAAEGGSNAADKPF